MKPIGKLKRFYLLVAGFSLIAAVLFLTVTRPLIRSERELDHQLQEAVRRLEAAGHGLNKAEVGRKIEALRGEIESFAAIASDPSRTIQFAPEVEPMLEQPFQLIDFDARKFFVLDHIRNLCRERSVELFDGWEQQFPTYTNQPPRRIWAQLTVLDQLLRTAIHAGVQRIDAAELVVQPDGQAAIANEGHSEVAVQMRLTGEMEAIHNVIMMLPLNGDELAALEFNAGPGKKSSFFLSRFILRKSSAERPDEVQIDLVASGFLDVAREGRSEEF